MGVELHVVAAPADGGHAVSAPAPIRVVLADDHELMRHGLRLTLDDAPDVEVIAEADDMATTIRQVHMRKPQVLVLDLRMRGGSSVETIGELREHAPDTKVVVLSMNDSPAFAQHALAAGALGFVLKELADSELPEAVHAAARGEKYVSPHVAARLAGRRDAAGRAS
jgi:two-component system, NarL family, response regulator NreC